VEDLRDLCRELNLRGAKFVVIGGFAIRAANDNRRTMPFANFNRVSFSNTTSSASAMKFSWT
jgi:hypothetical protein